jgi:hypothetical protein
MKVIGDPNLSMIPSTKNAGKIREYLNASKIKVLVACITCGVEGHVSQGMMARFHRKGYKCYNCNMKEQDEFNKTIIALAKRKGLTPTKRGAKK